MNAPTDATARDAEVEPATVGPLDTTDALASAPVPAATAASATPTAPAAPAGTIPHRAVVPTRTAGPDAAGPAAELFDQQIDPPRSATGAAGQVADVPEPRVDARGPRTGAPRPETGTIAGAPSVLPRPALPADPVVGTPDEAPAGPASDEPSTAAPDHALDQVAADWTSFTTTGDPTARERLILHYLPLVASVAARVRHRLPSTVEQADLVSYGMFGLIDAVEKYQPDRAVRFEAYAGARIRGAIIDELRVIDWVPRSVRARARTFDRAYADLEAELHRAPTEAEVADRMAVPVRELRSLLAQLAVVNVAALDELTGAGEGRASLLDTLGDDRTPVPGEALESRETRFLLARAVDQLGEREKLVLVLYYYEAMTLGEIGRVLGVTESRVSQLHSAAVLRLRSRLTEAGRG